MNEELLMPGELVELLMPTLLGVLPLAAGLFATMFGFKAIKSLISYSPISYSRRELEQMERDATAKKEVELNALREAESSKARKALAPPKRIEQDEPALCQCVICVPEKYTLRTVGVEPPKANASMRAWRRHWDGLLERRP